MRKFSAHYIITGTGKVLTKGIITLTDEGVIVDITDTNGDLEESAGVEFYSGVITPGFVNAHCHLELSHLGNAFPENSGLAAFLKNVAENRYADENRMVDEARKADAELWRNGTVAVGDVSNTNKTFGIKSKSKIIYHTFIEALGFIPQSAEKAFALTRQYFDENLKLDLSDFQPTGNSALESVIGWLPEKNNLLLVHNIRTTLKDIDLIGQTRSLDKTWFVICPGSNLFIENLLPDIELFRKMKLQICLGTDSLSSNRKLSILEEMKTMQTYFPALSLIELVTWSTRNGAEALAMDSWAGTIEIGKRPGINLITGMDLQELRLKPESKVRRLM